MLESFSKEWECRREGEGGEGGKEGDLGEFLKGNGEEEFTGERRRRVAPLSCTEQR